MFWIAKSTRRSKYEMRLNELFEARRNADVNFDGRLNDRRSSAFGFLSQFKAPTGDDPNYFVTFTEIPKVGINPMSKYQTPIGIYTYPITPEIIMGHTQKQLPFAGDEKYISVVQATVFGSKVCLFDDDGSYGADYERDYTKLLEFLEGGYDGDDCKGFLAAAAEAAYEPQDPASRIWNQSRWVAGAEAFMRTGTVTYGLGEIRQRMLGGKDIKGLPVNWNYVLRKVLGYEVIIDLGGGIIHANEPTQALFLSKEALSVVDQRLNQNGAGRGPRHVTLMQFFHLLNDRTISWSEFGNCISKILQGQKRALFRVDKIQHFIDKPVGQELDVLMAQIARLHMTKMDAATFAVNLRVWRDLPLWKVAPSTNFELLVMLIRNTVNNHSNPMVDPAYELNSIKNELGNVMSKFTFETKDFKAAIQHLELEHLYPDLF